MSEYDVRNQSQDFERIRVADMDGNWINAQVIQVHTGSGGVELAAGITEEDVCLVIPNKTEALNIIKGLQKAIELEWLK